MNILDQIALIDNKLFVTYITDNDLVLSPEDFEGHIEYKKTLSNCSAIKIENYATQMQWRIYSNIKHQYAIYYIGVNDDGTISGLNNEDIITAVQVLIKMTELIGASIVGIKVIEINDKVILKIGAKIKRHVSIPII